MAKGEYSKRVLNVGQLKKFLEPLPDHTRIRGGFDERIIATLWVPEADEPGLRIYVGFDEE